MKAGIKSEDIAVTLGTREVAMSRFVPVTVRLPDFVATGAGPSAGVTVVEAGAGQEQDHEQGDHQGRNDAKVKKSADRHRAHSLRQALRAAMSSLPRSNEIVGG